MESENDIIIITGYKESDKGNVEKKWISDFCKVLKRVILRLSGINPNIICDFETNENKFQQIMKKSVICICIISKQTANSESLKQRIKGVHSIFQKTDNKKIFKVLREDVVSTELPQELRESVSYNLFEVEKSTGNFIEIDISSPFNEFTNSWLQLIDLSYDIRDVLQSTSKRTDSTTKKAGNTVFLAETTDDQSHNREYIRRELQEYNFIILPDKILSSDKKQLDKEIRKCLEKSTISIHIIGNKYENPIEGEREEEQSLVEYQNYISAKFINEQINNNITLSRLIWIDPGMKLNDEKQKKFIEQLKHDSELLINAEIIQSPLELFKTVLLNKLKISTPTVLETTKTKQTASRKTIYIIYESPYKNKVDVVINTLKKSGFETIELNINEKETNLIQQHKQNLVKCDGVLIYYPGNNKAWLNSKLKDLLKAPGFGRKRPLTAKAVFIENVDEKIDINYSRDIEVIKSKKTISPELLNSFTNKL